MCTHSLSLYCNVVHLTFWSLCQYVDIPSRILKREFQFGLILTDQLLTFWLNLGFKPIIFLVIPGV